MNDRELRAALRGAGPADPAARERSWRVVRAAYAGGVVAPRAPRGRRRATALVALGLAVLAVGTAAAASAPGTGVGRFVRHVLGVRAGAPHARPALVHVPGGGRLLAQAGGTTWVVAADGAKRRLGAFTGASWSPHGLFVAGWRGGVLSAIEPGGKIRWSIARPQPVRAARWSPVDGFRVAYLSGGALRVVNGDGSGDRRVAAARAAVAPAWRPDAGHVLAYADARGRVVVIAVDAGVRLWRSGPLRGLRELAWAPDGQRLAAVAGGRLRVFGPGGAVLRAGHTAHVADVAWSPTGDRLALVRRAGSSSEVVVVAGGRERVVFTGPGRLGAAAWSPGGRWLLVPWPEADQWLFLRPNAGRARVAAVGRIAAQFGPGAAHPTFPADVQWCCPKP